MPDNESMNLYDIERELSEAMEEWHECGTDDIALELVLKAYVVAAKDKRDKMAQFVKHLEAQEESASREIARLQLRKKRFAAGRERLLAYCGMVMQSQGVKKLEGEHATFKRRKNPPSLKVTDIDKVPPGFKVQRVPEPYWEVDTKAIKAEYKEARALDVEGDVVAGTHLVEDNYRVVIE